MTAQHTTALQALLVDDGFDGEVYPQEMLSKHTSYRIGGPARFYVQVSSFNALKRLVHTCQSDGIDWFVIGKGSNLLISDAGFDGVVIALDRGFKTLHYDEQESRFLVGAGVALASLVQEAFKRGLAGLEFAVGIPGTVGGALRMNAGSRDEWIGSAVLNLTTFSPKDGLKRYGGCDIEWGYRSSSIPEDEIVLECEIAVKSTMPAQIRGKMEEFLAKRKKSQPLSYPSCGSVFKNPDGAFAAALIEKAELKGKTIGGAMVSTTHANFIVNTGEATAADVAELISLVQAKVQEEHGIELQPEVKLIGFA